MNGSKEGISCNYRLIMVKPGQKREASGKRPLTNYRTKSIDSVAGVAFLIYVTTINVD